jgi:DNA-binding LacI/PurR family transcriptional regulator
MKSILQNHKPEDLPTAIFCHNDHCAIGAMFAVNEAGYRIPDEFSFIGTDNIVTSAFQNPPLTTINLSAREIAAEVALLMLERLANADRAQRDSVVEPSLIERKSVRKL